MQPISFTLHGRTRFCGGRGEMDDLLTVVISVAGSAVTSFLVAKYYGERWVEKRRSRMEHSIRLKDGMHAGPIQPASA